MKKNATIYLLIALLTVLAVGSFAIYKSNITGNAIGNLADVKVYVESEENSTCIINPDNLSIDYDFFVDNYIYEDNSTSRNEVLCDYYIKISGLENAAINCTLYYIDSLNVGTALTPETDGAFEGYYKAITPLGITADSQDKYRLSISVAQDDLLSLNTNVAIDIGYEQHVESVYHVNAPDMTNGLIPVVWDDLTNQWVKTSTSNENWYDYREKRWANAVTANLTYDNGTDTNRPYSEAPDGTVIPNESITTMFVWVPRFVYRINETYFHSTSVTAQTFETVPVEIHFSKTESTGGDEWDENIIVVDNGTRAEDCRNGWTTHSAFDFGDTYLNGIWVAKFQASNSTGTATVNNTIDNVYIRPIVQMAEAIKIDNAFTACRLMESSNIYGFDQANTLLADSTYETNTNNLDTHLIKNSEWSAMAFLAHSKYGQGKNNIQNSVLIGQTYCGQGSTLEEIFVTNVNQSTTGNAYGVYDTSSLIWDIVAAYIGTGDNIHAPVLYSAVSKYKNTYLPPEGESADYSSKDAVYRIFEYIKDAAIWETSTSGNVNTTAWFSGRSNIGCYSSNKYNLLITRGGSYVVNNAYKDSIFAFGYGEGNDLEETRSFRPVLVIGNGI